MSKYSPLTIVTRALLANTRKYMIDFRSYVEIFEDNSKMQNSTRTRGMPAICLGLTIYRKLGQYFMSIVTRKKL